MSPREQQVRQEFERLVCDQLDSLYRTALRLLGSRADAEDAVQECCARAFRALEGFEPGGAMRPWLFRILKNICIDRLRVQSRVRLVTADEGGLAIEQLACPSQKTPEQNSLNAGLSRAIERALVQLPDEQRAVVIFVLIEDFSYAETAEVLQIPEGTVRSRLNRARRRLRVLLSFDETPEERRPQRPRLVM